MSRLYIVMPAYNEAENIKATIQQWYQIVDKIQSNGGECCLVIANDGSKDDTFAIMESLTSQYSSLIPLNKENSGHGATLMYLYRYAVEHGAVYIFQTDSDGQTNPYEFWEMWNNREDYDIQIGNRTSRQDGVGRIFVSFVLRLVTYLIFHTLLKDANTPFRLMKADRLNAILDVIPNDFFLCNVAIAAIAKKWNYKMGWQDISFKPRQGGVNSINMKRIFKIGIKALKDLRIIAKEC